MSYYKVFGVGTDIIAIERIKRVFSDDKARLRLFSENELAYFNKHQDPFPHIAGRFAAKEATVKAMGTGFRKESSWQDFSIENNEIGKPFLHLSNRLKKQYEDYQFDISISHCKEYAVAFVLISKREG